MNLLHCILLQWLIVVFSYTVIQLHYKKTVSYIHEEALKTSDIVI